LASTAWATAITYVAPATAPNGSSSIPTSTSYTSNLGYAFQTGSAGPYDIDWITLQLQTNSTATTGSFKIAIHAATNSTTSAVAAATAYATDLVTFSLSGVSGSQLTLNLTAADLPNITNYQLLANTAYALIVYNTSTPLALRRTQGLADGTTNASYTVTNGFTMLDTFRNNGANYTNAAGSYPNFHISFGANAVAAPVPPTVALLSTLLIGGLIRRRRRGATSK
ncbi:MAG: PEP-CTERM sorting domain-containing protein, partial [Pseudomonadales bacterium]